MGVLLFFLLWLWLLHWSYDRGSQWGIQSWIQSWIQGEQIQNGGTLVTCGVVTTWRTGTEWNIQQHVLYFIRYNVLTGSVLVTAVFWVWTVERDPGQGCQLRYEAFFCLLMDKETNDLKKTQLQACYFWPKLRKKKNRGQEKCEPAAVFWFVRRSDPGLLSSASVPHV